jgi:AraC family transcriptional regulator of adaptative response/methylated-DNA-[protein]-cysteine methyltransferase
MRQVDGSVSLALIFYIRYNCARDSNVLLVGQEHFMKFSFSILFSTVPSSIGTLLVARTQEGLLAILIGDDSSLLREDLQKRFPQAQLFYDEDALKESVEAIIGLVDHPKSTIPFSLDMRGTEFQKKVWNALVTIPVGKTISYRDLAETIGSPNAARAVARACAANNLALVIPCHRVIRRDGSSAGYRWGCEIKKRLIKCEQEFLQR